MLYEKENKRLTLSAAETASLCLYRTGAGVVYPPENLPEDLPPSLLTRLAGGTPPVTLSFLLPLPDGYSVYFQVLCARASEGGILCAVASPGGKDAYENRGKWARTYGFLALLAYRTEKGSIPPLCISYYDTLQDREEKIPEVVDKKTLDRFAEKLKILLYGEIIPAAEREERRPTVAALPFPYPTLRRGQKALIESVYHACRAGEKLFMTAPTGTGKTVSTLFPALRALGKGEIDKIFYLTPKSTTAMAAADTLQAFYEKGADLRAVIITAKEKICPRNRDCRLPGRKCPVSFSSREKETEAAIALLHDAVPVVTEKQLSVYAEKYKVCPYELTLRYAELCDTVICDYNYLFDLDVYIRRFFSVYGKFCFLIDEAHTLSERAPEMYSALFDPSFFDSLMMSLDGESQLYLTIKSIKSEYEAMTEKLLKDAESEDDHGVKVRLAAHKSLPCDIPKFFSRLSDVLTKAAFDRSESEERRYVLRKAHYEILSFLGKAAFYSQKYITFVSGRDTAKSLKLYCVDPSDVILSRLSKGKAAVFFSATLTPAAYYQSLLCGTSPAVSVECETPFKKEQMAVAVIDRYSVRFRERDDSLVGIVELIRRMIAAKAGNYFVFCPSFSYMELLSRTFTHYAPNVNVCLQKRYMSQQEREAFLAGFTEEPKETLVGFCVSGGVFGEGVDLAGTRLIGAAVIGVGLPSLSPEREAMRLYYDEKSENGREYAYMYPGLNRVLQAAGRVIRRTDDKGVILLVDDRFSEPLYRKALPPAFPNLRFVGDPPSLTHFLSAFWGQKSGKI